VDLSADFFSLFQLPRTFSLDSAELDTRYREIQGQVHPDRFTQAGDAERRLSMQWATQANEAYQTLKKPFERARYLLALNGVDAMDARNTSMPPDFLMQQMEWREALEDARTDKDTAALESLEKALRDEARDLRARLGILLDEQHDYVRAGDTLRKLRFMDKLQEEIGNAFEEIE